MTDLEGGMLQRVKKEGWATLGILCVCVVPCLVPTTVQNPQLTSPEMKLNLSILVSWIIQRGFGEIDICCLNIMFWQIFDLACY